MIGEGRLTAFAVLKKVYPEFNYKSSAKFELETKSFIETLPNGTKYLAVYNKKGTLQNTKKFVVPSDHFFLLGDNRDCSKDSRYLDSVGYVNNLNLVGEAKLIFFSLSVFQNFFVMLEFRHQVGSKYFF